MARARFTRAVAVVMLVVGSLCCTGCLHTWTQTYQDYPPEAWAPPKPHQGNPTDG